MTEVNAITSDCEIAGNVTEISYGTTVTLKIEDESNTVYSFALDISDLPDILRGETEISIDRLSIGDEVTITVEDCAVASVVAEGTEDTLTGQLTSITTTVDGTKWVITASDGTATTLTVDENAGVYSGSTAILISSIKVGDTVSVVTYASTITEVNLESSATTTSKVSGTVLAVSTTDKKITILTQSGKLIYVSTSSVSSILNASTGTTLKIGAIPVNSQLVAYGTYSNSTTFTAKSIVVED